MSNQIITEAQYRRVERALRRYGCVYLTRDTITRIAMGEPQIVFTRSHHAALRVAADALCVPLKVDPESRGIK